VTKASIANVLSMVSTLNIEQPRPTKTAEPISIGESVKDKEDEEIEDRKQLELILIDQQMEIRSHLGDLKRMQYKSKVASDYLISP